MNTIDQDWQLLDDQLAKVAHPRQLVRTDLLRSTDADQQRWLTGHTQAGISFRIAVDGGFDLVDLSIDGTQIGWSSPAGIHRQVDPNADDGFGLLRGFGGFLVTCGHDHIGNPSRRDTRHFQYPSRGDQRHPLHGRAWGLAATIEQIMWSTDRQHTPHLILSARLRQASMFGEVIDIKRTWRIDILHQRVRLNDIITNVGRTRCPQRTLYHLNFGYPLVDEGTRVTGTHACTDFPPTLAPLTGDACERFQVSPLTTPHRVSIAKEGVLNNRALLIDIDGDAFRYLGEWRCGWHGMNVLAIEPASDTLLAPEFESNEHWLKPGESVNFSLSVKPATQHEASV